MKKILTFLMIMIITSTLFISVFAAIGDTTFEEPGAEDRYNECTAEYNSWFSKLIHWGAIRECKDLIDKNDENSMVSKDKLNKTVGNIWHTFVAVVQILAFGAVVFAGLRYMFASADKKADIKRGMGYLAVGAIIVFGAATIAQFVVNVAQDII